MVKFFRNRFSNFATNWCFKFSITYLDIKSFGSFVQTFIGGEDRICIFSTDKNRKFSDKLIKKSAKKKVVFDTLDQDGTYTDTNLFTKNKNGTFNSWNVDLRYSWWFAPGSQLTLLYRNAVGNYLETSRLGFKDNFNRLFDEPMVNNISLKLTYYIDYNWAKSLLN